ncbi:MAG TPA: helix-turn-helix domain-containing protein [Microbacteriaceae bacterium]|nr:helix-turn-helix domain-containing protein [Microbacteriaceae bacterium]
MKRERGRPIAATDEAIFQAAFEVFREVGFEATTMPMIAERVGIGRSTLFRRFPNTTAIMWYARAELTEEFRANLAAQPVGTDLSDGAFAAYRAIWTARPDLIENGKDMLRIVETAGPESVAKWQAYGSWAELVHGYVLERTGLPETDTTARAAAMAIWAAIWAGAVEFALTDSDSIDEHLRRARSAIEVRLPDR